VIVAAGFLHVVRGTQIHRWPGVQICKKLGGWTLRNTFMDLDEYVGNRERVAALEDEVVVALLRCGATRSPPVPLDDIDDVQVVIAERPGSSGS
jgi:hypothetical protein